MYASNEISAMMIAMKASPPSILPVNTSSETMYAINTLNKQYIIHVIANLLLQVIMSSLKVNSGGQ